jgi:hypothetical protein
MLDEGQVPERVKVLVEQGLALYSRLLEPVGVRAEISREEFARVYEGKGRNAAPAPLTEILAAAERLALFAVTVGAGVCNEISRLFEVNDPALGYMLDSIASLGAEQLATAMAHELEQESGDQAIRVLPYSPGYCGWDLSGQARLFAVLQPEEIGISLNPRFLMQPIKSVSGVLVAAPGEVHAFPAGSFAFCAECRNQTCQERIESVM